MLFADRKQLSFSGFLAEPPGFGSFSLPDTVVSSPFFKKNKKLKSGCFPCGATVLRRDMRTGSVTAPGGADARSGAFPRGRSHLERCC